MSKTLKAKEIFTHWNSKAERLDGGKKIELLVKNEDLKQKLDSAGNLEAELN